MRFERMIFSSAAFMPCFSCCQLRGCSRTDTNQISYTSLVSMVHCENELYKSSCGERSFKSGYPQYNVCNLIVLYNCWFTCIQKFTCLVEYICKMIVINKWLHLLYPYESVKAHEFFFFA